MALKCILVFSSTYLTIRAGEVLKNKIELTFIPVPRQISSDCGICLMFEDKYKEQVISSLKEKEIKFKDIRTIEL